METFTYQDVKQAFERIHPYLPTTPLIESYYLGNEQQRYFFKLESLQRVKSFKIRGALNKMLTLTDEEKTKGVATISSGNHGISVSYAAALLGIKEAIVIVPTTTPKSKVNKIKYFGATVVQLGKNYDEAHALGHEYIKDKDMVFIDSYYDDPKIYAGQGTMAMEILAQNPEIDTIVVPIGGGGMITGIAVAAKAINPGIRIIGVQTAACPAMVKAFEDNVFYEAYPNEESYCDSLVGGVGKLSYEMLGDYVDDIVVVSESSIAQAVAFMITEEKFVAEAGSCTTIVAVQNFRERVGGKNVALIISGGNIDGAVIKEILEKY